MRKGEVVQLGQHRLMCGDAGDPQDVAALFGDAKPDLTFCSPPYLQQRAYGKAIDCWDTLMQRVFGAMPHHEKTQVLVNLGLVHREGEWLPYWDGWIEWMRAQGWRRFGWYVWDKGSGLPGDWHGRFAPSFEFIYHFNNQVRRTNKSVVCKSAGLHGHKASGGLRAVSGATVRRSARMKVSANKVQDNVIRTPREGNHRTKHPAVFPVALPAAIHAAYTDPGELVYDPFAGSGTSIIAAEQGGRVCYAMELEPAYCDIAIERWRKRKPVQQPLAL